MTNIVCIHHNKDMDGYSSGAIVKLKYPDAELIGWDYKDPIPEFEQFRGKNVIMIDITFPIEELEKLSQISSSLTVIDHHISFFKQFKDRFMTSDAGNSAESFTNVNLLVLDGKFQYIYEAGVAACEIGWKNLFPNDPVPHAITLIGRYDTWRQKEGEWENETLPFKYYMYGQSNSVETFPTHILALPENVIDTLVQKGVAIMKYQQMMDEAMTTAYSFEREAFGGLRAICCNVPYFSSETVGTAYNPDKHDIMIGFAFGGDNWRVSLRSAKPEVDVSVIAKGKGGGGHKGAAGFQVENFEDIFK